MITYVPQLKVLSASVLDDRTKLFSDSAFSFSNTDTKAIKEDAYNLCYHYGKYIVENELTDKEKSYMKHFSLDYEKG